jgi:hypothetical protein
MHDQMIGTARPAIEGSDAGYLPEVMSWGCDTHTESPHWAHMSISDASYTLLPAL